MRAIPGSLAIPALLLIGEDILQQALGLTGIDPAEALTNPTLASLFVWKLTGLWLVTLLVIRAVADGRRGLKLWRIHGLALAALALMIALTVGEVAVGKLVHIAAVWLAGDLKWLRVTIGICGLLGTNLAELRFITLLAPAWRLGDGAVGPIASWRGTRGNTMRIFLAETLLGLPVLALHYAIAFAFEGGTADAGHLAWLGLDGIVEVMITVLDSVFLALVYRRLRPFATPDMNVRTQVAADVT
jgi:hypothetical protein